MVGHDLAGKVALVTGGSRGLGKEMSWALAREGAHVIIASRKEESCRELAEEITRETGVDAVGLGVHVGEWDSVTELATNAYDAFGRVDVLINNAGISPLYPSLDEVSEALFDKIFDVNIKGPFRLSSLIGPRMAAAGGGSIINISSNASERPAPEYVPYGAAKAALNSLTKGLAATYGPAVRVNTIMCGAFFTDIAKGWDRDAFDDLASAWPIPRGGDPAEIVGAVLYFAGASSSYTTGALLPVDGGRMAIG
ncbi:glucose 1-dehydrogenase [Gordonia jinghuaiqii]|uniref:SDR family oxidoreductase n=1 Tax=Gordonia jinghuaiqii TaxID=2758710 RepID=A0A7D7LT11_9ACTN|nr:SDR family oxidoreductase [Gordonia jinghuaiqii]MCR5979811.1 glucose 1-dehydrogenase [Gordonia jinghuaiqii]QMT00801.1 SDR family oxidoreductase [Gordonia jinghuaiqii]